MKKETTRDFKFTRNRISHNTETQLAKAESTNLPTSKEWQETCEKELKTLFAKYKSAPATKIDCGTIKDKEINDLLASGKKMFADKASGIRMLFSTRGTCVEQSGYVRKNRMYIYFCDKNLDRIVLSDDVYTGLRPRLKKAKKDLCL